MKRILIIAAMLLSVAGVADARQVSGKVTDGDAGLGKVIVTDGYNFTTTKKNGKFKLKLSDEARYVYVVTPSGYIADYKSGVPEYYKKIDDSSTYNFELQEMPETEKFTIFAISDPQVKTTKQLKTFSGKPCKDLKKQGERYAKKGNVIGILLGDEGWNDFSLYPGLKEQLAATGIPYYSIIGNHDYIQNLDGTAAAADYEASFGPVNWAFYINDYLVIGLNNIMFKGNGTDDKIKSSNDYIEGYDEATLNFLENILNLSPDNSKIILAQHSSVYGSPFDPKGDTIVNLDKALALLDGRTVEIVCGHSHLMQNFQPAETIREHNAASICGNLWKGPKYCWDGSPRGYYIFSITPSKLKWQYHCIDMPDSQLANVYAPGSSEMNPEIVLVNVWDYSKGWSVKWYQDGVDMGEMSPVKDIDPAYLQEQVGLREASKVPKYFMPHYFGVKPAAGTKSVKVEVSDLFGKTYTQEIELN